MINEVRRSSCSDKCRIEPTGLREMLGLVTIGHPRGGQPRTQEVRRIQIPGASSDSATFRVQTAIQYQYSSVIISIVLLLSLLMDYPRAVIVDFFRVHDRFRNPIATDCSCRLSNIKVSFATTVGGRSTARRALSEETEGLHRSMSLLCNRDSALYQ